MTPASDVHILAFNKDVTSIAYIIAALQVDR